MAQALNNISIILFILAVVFAVVSVIFWFVFRIKDVIGDLSGRNARKSIERMRADNEKSNKKQKRQSAQKIKPEDKLTETMDGISKSNAQRNNDETGILSENVASMRNSSETALLTDDDVTAALVTGELGETELMDTRAERRTATVKLQMINEVIIVNTNEAI